jgi:DNA-binding response OmpR family regulator
MAAGKLSMPTRLLIVDDDPDICQILRDRLESRGYVIDVAGNALEAILMIDKSLPTGILLDFMLPAIDGLQLLREVRRAYPLLPVVVITANKEEHFAARAIAAGADDVLFKPLSGEELMQVVHRCFGPPS